MKIRRATRRSWQSPSKGTFRARRFRWAPTQSAQSNDHRPSGKASKRSNDPTRHFISVGFPRLGTLAKTSCRTRTASAARPAISRIRTGTSTGSAAGWRRTSLWEHVIPTIRLSAYVWADLQAGQRSIDRRHHICSQGSLCQGTGVFLDLGNCTEAGNWQRAGRTRP